MLPAKEAEAIILNLVEPLNPDTDTEIVNLDNATGRILAKEVKSKLDFPYWDNSAMDGYAVLYEDVKNCSTENPITLNIVTEIPAGTTPKKNISSGETARIFTGAMLPTGSDTIVIQENTERENNKVKILAPPQYQQFVRKKGSFYKASNTMLSPHISLNAPDIAILATAQCTEIEVYRRPKISIISTGNELVSPDTPLKPGQIVDSNQYALASFVRNNGAIPLCWGIVPDDPNTLKEIMKKAIQESDFVLSTGGVSVGDYDYVEQILEELGGEIHVRSVAVKPGKPLTVAKFSNSCLYFGIPGNPVSALVSCWRFVKPAIKKLSGLNTDFQPTFIKAITHHELKAGGKRETYLWGQLKIVEGVPKFYLSGGTHNSGNLINLSQTNALAIVPRGETLIKAESQVTVMQLSV